MEVLLGLLTWRALFLGIAAGIFVFCSYMLRQRCLKKPKIITSVVDAGNAVEKYAREESPYVYLFTLLMFWAADFIIFVIWWPNKTYLVMFLLGHWAISYLNQRIFRNLIAKMANDILESKALKIKRQMSDKNLQSAMNALKKPAAKPLY
jgi:hypothetical protein